MRHRSTITIEKSRETIIREALALQSTLEVKHLMEDECQANVPPLPPLPTYTHTPTNFRLTQYLIRSIYSLRP